MNCMRRRRDKANQAVDEDHHTFAFKVGQVNGDPVRRPQKRRLMIDTGATSHIVTDITKFKDFDVNFKPQKHIMELADGERPSGVTLKRGARCKAATARGATVIFKVG